MGAAYALGACGSDAALAALATALHVDGNESARRAGSLGLGAAGDRAVPALLRVLAASGISGLVAGSASRGRVCHKIPISAERAQRYIRS